MTPELAAWAAIGLMAGVSFATRILGPELMLLLAPSKRMSRFLDTLSSSVLVAIVASFLAQGGAREAAAIATAAAVMLLTRKALWALGAGVVVAASWAYATG